MQTIGHVHSEISNVALVNLFVSVLHFFVIRTKYGIALMAVMKETAVSHLEYLLFAWVPYISQIGKCGGNFTTSSGAITSPSWPKGFSTNETCSNKISLPSGTYVNLTVLVFQLGDYNSAYLEIRDGGSEESPLMGRFWGSDIPSTMLTTKNYMWIR